MSNLIAITFDGPQQASEALRAIRQIERRGRVHLTDTAVVTKDADGHVHTKNELDSGVEVGIGVVGTLGLLVGIAFPVAGVAAGLLGAPADGWQPGGRWTAPRAGSARGGVGDSRRRRATGPDDPDRDGGAVRA